MALLYAGGLFSGALADRVGTHRVAAAGALLAGGSLVAASGVATLWQADLALGLGFGLGLAVCYTPAIAAVQPWFTRNRGVASGIALSGTGAGTLLMPLFAKWLIDTEGWRLALIVIGLGVAGFGCLAANWIRRPAGSPATASSPRSRISLGRLTREPSFRRLYLAGFLSSLVPLVPVVHMVPHAVRAGVAPRDAAWLISILGFGSLAGRLDLWHSDMIASCLAAVCLVAAGYFFAAKPPAIRLHGTSLYRPRLRHPKIRSFVGLEGGRLSALPALS
jgi:MFS family permease